MAELSEASPDSEADVLSRCDADPVALLLCFSSVLSSHRLTRVSLLGFNKNTLTAGDERRQGEVNRVAWI